MSPLLSNRNYIGKMGMVIRCVYYYGITTVAFLLIKKGCRLLLKLILSTIFWNLFMHRPITFTHRMPPSPPPLDSTFEAQ